MVKDIQVSCIHIFNGMIHDLNCPRFRGKECHKDALRSPPTTQPTQLQHHPHPTNPGEWQHPEAIRAGIIRNDTKPKKYRSK